MADGTDIEWATHPVTGKGATWNPIVGCTIESPGCTHCYAMKLAGTRLRSTPSRRGLTKPSKNGPVWTGEVRFVEEWLTQPLHWREPRGIFVCAHGDLFAPGAEDEWIDKIFAVMALAPQHIFMVLTKRPARMRQYLTERWQPAPAQTFQFGSDVLNVAGEGEGSDRGDRIREAIEEIIKFDKPLEKRFADLKNEAHWTADGDLKVMQFGWPLPNVWLGTSVEDQKRADERIPALLATPAAKRFISAEPLLEAIDLTAIHRTQAEGFMRPLDGRFNKLDWVIAGFESGTLARVAQGAPDIARSLRDQCAAAGVPFFFKQWGSWAFAPDGMNYQEAMSWGTINRHSLSQKSQDWGGSGGRPSRFEQFSDGRTAFFTSKAKAGRLLDGVTHSAMPAVG